MQIYDMAIEQDGDEKVYPASLQYRPDFELYFQRLLNRAHNQKLSIRCLCPGPGRKRLAVRLMGSTNKHYLARYPLTRMEHDASCQFASETPPTHAQVQASPGPASGTMQSLPVKGVPQRWHVRIDETAFEDMSLTDVLAAWWRTAGMNIWKPAFDGKRSVGLVMHHLCNAGKNVFINGRSLHAQTLFAASSIQTKTYLDNVALMKQATEKGDSLFVVAPMAAYQLQRYDRPKHLPISNFHGIPRLQLDAEQWNESMTLNTMAFDLWRQGVNTIALVALEPALSTEVAEVRQFGLMSVTEQWVPVKNWRELVLAKKLVSERRHFLRPMSLQPKLHLRGPAFYLTDRQPKIALHIGAILAGTDNERKRGRPHNANASATSQQEEWMWNGIEASTIPDFP